MLGNFDLHCQPERWPRRWKPRLTSPVIILLQIAFGSLGPAAARGTVFPRLDGPTAAVRVREAFLPHVPHRFHGQGRIYVPRSLSLRTSRPANAAAALERQAGRRSRHRGADRARAGRPVGIMQLELSLLSIRTIDSCLTIVQVHNSILDQDFCIGCHAYCDCNEYILIY